MAGWICNERFHVSGSATTRRVQRTSSDSVLSGCGVSSERIGGFADEFLTKCMYHYRWTKDPFYAGRNIVLQQLGGSDVSDDFVDRIGTQVRTRQVGRLKIVGLNVDTGPTIEAFYEKFMRLMEKHLKSGHAFLLGSRPSAADFAILVKFIRCSDPETSHFQKIKRQSLLMVSQLDGSFGISLLDESKGWIKEVKGQYYPTRCVRSSRASRKVYVPFVIANDGKETKIF